MFLESGEFKMQTANKMKKINKLRAIFIFSILYFGVGSFNADAGVPLSVLPAGVHNAVLDINADKSYRFAGLTPAHYRVEIKQNLQVCGDLGKFGELISQQKFSEAKSFFAEALNNIKEDIKYLNGETTALASAGELEHKKRLEFFNILNGLITHYIQTKTALLTAKDSENAKDIEKLKALGNREIDKIVKLYVENLPLIRNDINKLIAKLKFTGKLIKGDKQAELIAHRLEIISKNIGGNKQLSLNGIEMHKLFENPQGREFTLKTDKPYIKKVIRFTKNGGIEKEFIFDINMIAGCGLEERKTIAKNIASGNNELGWSVYGFLNEVIIETENGGHTELKLTPQNMTAVVKNRGKTKKIIGELYNFDAQGRTYKKDVVRVRKQFEDNGSFIAGFYASDGKFYRIENKHQTRDFVSGLFMGQGVDKYTTLIPSYTDEEGRTAYFKPVKLPSEVVYKPSDLKLTLEISDDTAKTVTNFAAASANKLLADATEDNILLTAIAGKQFTEDFSQGFKKQAIANIIQSPAVQLTADVVSPGFIQNTERSKYQSIQYASENFEKGGDYVTASVVRDITSGLNLASLAVVPIPLPKGLRQLIKSRMEMRALAIAQGKPQSVWLMPVGQVVRTMAGRFAETRFAHGVGNLAGSAVEKSGLMITKAQLATKQAAQKIILADEWFSTKVVDKAKQGLQFLDDYFVSPFRNAIRQPAKIQPTVENPLAAIRPPSAIGTPQRSVIDAEINPNPATKGDNIVFSGKWWQFNKKNPPVAVGEKPPFTVHKPGTPKPQQFRANSDDIHIRFRKLLEDICNNANNKDEVFELGKELENLPFDDDFLYKAWKERIKNLKPNTSDKYKVQIAAHGEIVSVNVRNPGDTIIMRAKHPNVGLDTSQYPFDTIAKELEKNPDEMLIKYFSYLKKRAENALTQEETFFINKQVEDIAAKLASKK